MKVHLSEDKKSCNFLTDISSINFSDENSNKGIIKNAIYEGDFKHHQGYFKLQEKNLDNFVKNFDDKVIGIEPAINYNHNVYEKASGWIKGVKKTSFEKQLSNEKVKSLSGLDLEVEWTPSAKKAIKDGEYKYFSIEFAFDFTNSETQGKHKDVITGGALTNKPFLKQPEVVAFNQKENKNNGGKEMSTMKELKLSLSEDHGLNLDSLLEDSKQLSEVKKENKQLSEKLEDKETQLSELKEKFENEKIEHLLNESIEKGKILNAEKEMHFELFKSLGLEKTQEFCEKLQVKVKFEAKGTSVNESEEKEEVRFEDDLNNQIKKFSQENKVSYEEAYKSVVYGGAK